MSMIAHMLEAITAGYICVAMDYGLATTSKWFFRHDRHYVDFTLLY